MWLLNSDERKSTVRWRMDVAAIVCLLLGDTAGSFLFPTPRPPLLLSWVFWAGAGLLVVRHAIRPTPTIFAVLWSAARERLRRPVNRRLLALVVATRLGVLAVGLIASTASPQVFSSLPTFSRNAVENLPVRWDSLWYYGIARQGYRWDATRGGEQQNIAFFPAYPLLMRTGGDIVTIPAKLLRDPDWFGSGAVRVMWGGVLVSIACFSVAMWRLFRLARLDAGNASAALRACVLAATYPFSLFFSVPYSESLALLALVSVTLAWREGHTRVGVLWGLVLGLSRPNGWTMTAALLADRLLGRSHPWTERRGWVFVAAAPVAGAAIYSAYVHRLTGNALEWALAQRAWGGVFRPWWFVVRRWERVQEDGLAAYLAQDPLDWLTLVAVIFMIAIATWMAARRQPLYAVLMVAYITPALVIDLPATGRMTALLFPAFLALGSWLRGGPFVALVALFALGQAWFAWRFFVWSTPY
ncbi:MAG: hypothetical protein M3541_05320 [Acidobacteriota bacterium]|nr:hypothetical protein [Acidobacteriota bacterium]MDQ3418189.1 hypothetical protein [Acidobacteriota bacterium]